MKRRGHQSWPVTEVRRNAKSSARGPKRTLAARNADSASVTAADASAESSATDSTVPSKGTAGAIHRYSRIGLSVCLFIVAAVAATYALYAGSAVALPLALAVVLTLLFQPIVQTLSARLRLPQVIGALVVVLGLVGVVGGLAIGISAPASNWVQKVPQILPAIEQKLAILRKPIEYLQKSVKQIEQLASPGGNDGRQVTVAQPWSIANSLAANTATVLDRLVTMLIMLFFLLAFGDRLLRASIEIMPRFSDKRRTVEIASEIQRQIGAYLLTITIMNSLVGVATGFAMWASGLGDPILWGTSAFLLNFVPIIGPLVGISVLALAGIVEFDWPWPALLPAMLYLLIHLTEGEVVTPMLLARRFTLNPMLVILSLFFWFGLWNVPGAILAVPLLGMTKIVCDRVEPLQPLGHLIGA